MARTSYQPERDKLEPRYGKGDPDFKHVGFGDETPKQAQEAPEMASVAEFVSFLEEEERTEYTTAELVELAENTGIYNTTLRHMLTERGFTLKGRTAERSFATFGTNQHDRWTCEESRRMNGGGGGDSIIGIAGRVG